MIKNYDSRNMKCEIKIMGVRRRFSFNITVRTFVRICVSNDFYTTLIIVCKVCYYGLNIYET